jgi:glutaredoxin
MEKKDNTVLRLYTLKNCIHCQHLKGKLKENDILYNEIIIDDGTQYNSNLGDMIEAFYETESYPILEIRPINNGAIIHSFISKTDLVERDTISIFDDIEQLIIQLKLKL